MKSSASDALHVPERHKRLLLREGWLYGWERKKRELEDNVMTKIVKLCACMFTLWCSYEGQRTAVGVRHLLPPQLSREHLYLLGPSRVHRNTILKYLKLYFCSNKNLTKFGIDRLLNFSAFLKSSCSGGISVAAYNGHGLRRIP